jgi:HlyD family secretion protein
MGKNEWIKIIALILFGITIDRLLSPNPQVQALLYSIFALKLWGIPMNTVILVVMVVALGILVWRLERSEHNKKKSSANVPTLESKVDAIIKKLGISQEDIEDAKAQVEQARASLKLAETQLSYTLLFSPLSGVCLVKSGEIGEVVNPGTPILTLADLKNVWLKAYIPESDLGKVKWGQEVIVTTDLRPQKEYKGKISFISSQAEFTPKSIQTEKERVTLVYRIKVDIPNPDRELKPGMPADGKIFLTPSSTQKQ